MPQEKIKCDIFVEDCPGCSGSGLEINAAEGKKEDGYIINCKDCGGAGKRLSADGQFIIDQVDRIFKFIGDHLKNILNMN